MIYAFANCEIDTDLFELRRDGQPHPVEPQVYDLLLYLIRNAGRVTSKRELLEVLWPDRAVCESALSHCVMAARRAIGDDGRRQQFIKTVHRRGYRFVAKAA